MSLPEDQKQTLMKIAGARLGGSTFMAIYTAHGTVYREARNKSRVLTPVATGRTLMASQVQPLIDAEFVKLRYEGTAVVIEETGKKP